jgi:uncharacterized protein
MGKIQPTERTTLKRRATRGSYDRGTIYKILDEGLVCQLGFVSEGRPFVIPTSYGRTGDRLFIHGSRDSRMLGVLGEGGDVCLTVTLVDGLVLARSAFHHSINYRSVMVFGQARIIADPQEKTGALQAIMEHIMRGRWKDVRKPTPEELGATSVLSIELREASAKIRTGPPVDAEEDYGLPVWAGTLPVRSVWGEPMNDPRLRDTIRIPRYISEYRRPAS